MAEFFKQLRIAAYLTAVLTIVSGIVLTVWPLDVMDFICRILGVLLAVMGAVYIFGYFVESRGFLSITGGLIFLLLGVWIFITPGSVVRLVPIVIGVVLLVHSLRDFQMASEAKRSGSERWMMLFLMALLNCVFGIVCICDSFGVISLYVRLIGAALIYDGVSNMIITYHTVQAVRRAAEKYEVIDVQAHEMEE